MPLPVLYGIMREDLNLPPGKSCCKAAEALLKSLHKASPDLVERYFDDGEGTQIMLTADEPTILRAHADATALGIPCSLVVERGKTIACGIGPVDRNKVWHLTKDLPKMR